MVKVFNKYQGSEDSFQISVARFLDNIPALKNKWTHIANEGKTDLRRNSKGQVYSLTGAKNKAKGKKKGLPDVMIFKRNANFIGYAIELKVGYNKPSPEQNEWLKSLENEGWKTLVSYSLDEVIYEVEKYLK